MTRIHNDGKIIMQCVYEFQETDVGHVLTNASLDFMFTIVSFTGDFKLVCGRHNTQAQHHSLLRGCEIITLQTDPSTVHVALAY